MVNALALLCSTLEDFGNRTCVINALAEKEKLQEELTERRQRSLMVG